MSRFFVNLTLFFLILPMLSSCGARESNVLVIDDFESGSSLGNWKGPVSIASENAAHGASCLRIDLGDRRSRVLETTALPTDWSGYELLKFDIYNPSGLIQSGGIQIFDELADDEQAQWEGQSYRGRKIFMIGGWNHYEFKVQRANVEEGDRALAIDRIRKLVFDFGRLGSDEIFLDNIRLVSGEEPAGSASRAEPTDCRVVIDDRYVDPVLQGPEDAIVPSREIAGLRQQASAAVDRLEELVRRAEDQNLQTLYWRIPLITARIGREVRGRLVWCRNEEEEGKILRHIVSSCTETSDELEKVLAGGSGIDPEEYYVEPLPGLAGLKPRDGFFRYEDGEPVVLLAMHGVSRGPLLDYFAPYDHVHESYTVGGGSRMDIESSPVYEAFHKYPDTHRVGWDGWCGHLIKDRWSMGGRKETVVICLESPHIREAVKEYMVRRYERWKKMPNLMYNIMAYELMYICYCERSQRMFREWLEDRHGSIARVNEVWGTSHGSFGEIRAPETSGGAPVPDVNRAAWYDWACFNTRRFTDYLKWARSEIRKLDPDIPINAGGTSSMLSSSNSTTGIDEEMIVNEVDDVILNESGGSQIMSDLMISLPRRRMAMVEPEMGGGARNILLHFLHGKSTIAKWLWREQNSREFPSFAYSSIPISWDLPLSGVEEVLRVALDVRRLNNEIEDMLRPAPEVAIFYSKSSIVQVPPRLHRSGSTPYLDAVHGTWEGSRYLGCRVGFVTEGQILDGWLERYKLLIVPAAKYSRPEVTGRILDYVKAGGAALVVPESFLFDQYARENDMIGELGITVTDVTLPPVLGEGETVQNYDQSITQTLVYGDVSRGITARAEDIFSGGEHLRARGLVQTIDPGPNKVLASFDDGGPALVLVEHGSGKLYYLAAPLEPADYHTILAPLAGRVGLTRPVLALDDSGKPVTGAEVRAFERGGDYLVYASNLTDRELQLTLTANGGNGNLGAIRDLRSLKTLTGPRMTLAPWQETILSVAKAE